MKSNQPSSKIQQLLQATKQAQTPVPNPVPKLRQSPQTLHWKPAKLIRRITQNTQLQTWLTLESSLTENLQQICPSLKVLILSEDYATPLSSEAQCLELASHQKAWIRCVVLQCQEHNLIYARTVIPEMDDNNPWHDLQRLGNKPLGEVLFEDNRIQRTPFQFSQQNLKSWPYLAPHLSQSLVTPPSHHLKGYARRSVFLKHQMPLLLTEVFLPDLLAKID